SSLAGVLAHAGSRESLEPAERAVALARERGTALEGEAWHLSALATACIAMGDAGRARLVAEEAVEVARRRGTRRWEVSALLALARALRASGDAASRVRAREALAQMDAVADAIHAPNWHHLADLERAELAAVEGDKAARQRHLRAALAGFEAIEAEYRVR